MYPSPLPPQPAIITRILHQLHANPAHCALQFRAHEICNAALLGHVLRLARRFTELGVARECRVAVCMERCPEQLVALLALWHCGAVYIPFDTALPRERLLDMCSVADVSVLLTQAHLQPQLSTLPVQILTLADMNFCEWDTAAADSPALQQADAPAAQCATSAVAYILFTSGSTGMPKGVLITQRNLAALFAGIDSVLPSCAERRVLACAAYGFDIALFELLAPLLSGGTIVLADQDTCGDPEALAKLIVSARIDVIQATPSLWQLLNRCEWNPGRRRILALATGEALPRSVAAAILRRTPLLWNLYGPTECTIWATAQQVHASDVSETAPAIVSIGTALPHVLLEVHEPASELWIGGEGVGAGYCGPAALTKTAFVDCMEAPDAGGTVAETNGTMQQPGGTAPRWYRSGDQCRRTPDGRLHFVGRLDSQVKVNGYRIELDEITRLLLQHASIMNAVCLTRALPDGRGTLLFACVVFIPGRPNKNRHGLNQYLARFLPAWMLPHRYYFLTELPLTTNGKLDRAALLALAAPVTQPYREYGADGLTASSHAEPDNARPQSPDAAESAASGASLDARVAALFCEVLDISAIGPCDSFLDFGGSSMLSATLVMLLNQRFGSQLTLRQALATPPTVQSIVKLLQPFVQTEPALQRRHN